MIEHTPLELAKLSPAAQKALGPAKALAARGMAPLSPADQITVLYQLSIDPDAKLAETARQTSAGLPDSILAGALGNQSLDARVLDYFAPIVAEKPAAFDSFIQNPAVADDTVAVLAAKVGAREIDRIAANEQRLLRHPQIIGAMYLNKHARMSTVDRVIELAVRNDVRVPGLVAWDEIARSLQGGGGSAAEADAIFAMAADAIEGDDSLLTAGDAEKPLEHDENLDNVALEQTKNIPIGAMSVPAKIRLATLGNAFQRAVLIRDPMKIVAMAAVKSPGVTEFEAAHYAGNQTLGEDVIRFIASKREWTKLYGTKYALCRNPKTPVTDAMRLMPFLREKDLTTLMKSKGVPSAVVAQARKLMMQRRGGAGDKK